MFRVLPEPIEDPGREFTFQELFPFQIKRFVSKFSLRFYLFQYMTYFLVVYYSYDYLPTPNDPRIEQAVPSADLVRRFSAVWAKEETEKLVHLGPRVTGSDTNEKEAVAILMNAIKKIKDTARWKIQSNLQRGDGSFSWNRPKANGVYIQYKGVQNVLARLSFGDSSKGNKAVLINCHFDTVPWR